MAKAARRSVASDPSSPTLSSTVSRTSTEHSKAHQHTNSTQFPAASSSSLHTDSQQHPSTAIGSGGRIYTTAHNGSGNSYADRTGATAKPFSPDRIGNVNPNSTSHHHHHHHHANKTSIASSVVAAERERIRMEFYATYDVMTGVRIAATLGGFFGLMVFLIVYKSRSSSNETIKVLKDPKIAAVAAACMQEEEEREIQEAIEATGLSLFPDEYEYLGYRRERLMSLGNVSAPPVLNRGFRFSSVGGGGYSSLLEPPRRYSYSGSRRKSTSECSRVLSAYPMGGSFGIDDFFMETDGDEADDEFDQITSPGEVPEQTFLSVPSHGQESRRSSAITCCSTDSSYLERRCSAVTLGIQPMSSISSRSVSRRTSATAAAPDAWDYFYPDIQVIRPTPKTSPCPSEKTTHTDRYQHGAGACAAASGATSRSYHQQQQQRGDSFDYISEYPEEERYNTTESNHYHNPSDYSASKHYHPAVVIERRPSHVSDEQRSSNSHRRSLKFSAARQSTVVDVEAPPSAATTITPNTTTTTQQHIIRRAPLASLSSFKISSADYQDADLHSLGSDSVFAESYADTDDDMEQFSTDSDVISDIQTPQHKRHPVVTKTSVSADIELQPRDYKSMQSASACAPRHYAINEQTASGAVVKKSTSFSNVNKIVTKAIIERHQQNQQQQQQQQQQQLPHSSTGNGSQPKTRSSSYCGYSSSAASTSSATVIAAVTDPCGGVVSNNNSNTSSNKNNNNGRRSNPSPTTVDNNCVAFSCSGSNNSAVAANVVVVENIPIVSSTSVILELPVISTAAASSHPEDQDDPPMDPSLAGTSRKWSRETLF